MKQPVSISIFLDTRRAKFSGKYPIKLRVYSSNPRKQKLIQTKFEYSEKEFDSIWNTNKPRKEYKESRMQLQALELRACKIAESLTPFSFEQFEKQLYRKTGDGHNVKYHYDLMINEFNNRNQIGTADTYTLSQKSIEKYVEEKLKLKYKNLTLFQINKNWLEGYESYMTDMGKSLTTVSIYLRVLRAVFNKTIDENEIEKEYYPFGKRKYQIPSSKNTKKALSKEHLKILFNSKPKTTEQQKAKDFWFLSYACNGMNMKDIALLKFKNVKNDKIEFYRAKTKLTSKTDLKPISVYLNEFIRDVLTKYSNKDKKPNSFVFNILISDLTPLQEQAKIKNFTRYINQHIKELCKANGLPVEVSTYWARHSFATNSIRKGASMEFIQESFGHGELKTTQSYFAGFDSDTKKEFAESLMDFD